MRGLFFILSGLMLLLLAGCNPSRGGTTTGNPVVAMSFAPFSETAPASKVTAQSTISELRFCFKRLRFKGDNIENIDFDIGEIALSPDGTELSMVSVPSGIYTRVEFDLESGCSSGKSLVLTKASGTYSTTDTITIRFDGQFTVSQSLQDLTLFLSNILSSLDGVTNDGEIKTAAEMASGDF